MAAIALRKSVQSLSKVSMRRDNNPVPKRCAIRSVSTEEFSAMYFESFFAEHATDKMIRERYFSEFSRMRDRSEEGS